MKNRMHQIAVLITLLFAPIASAQVQPSAHLFFEQLSALCGSKFEGEMTFPVDGQDSFKGKILVASFAECNAEEIRVPFIVGDDASRTWVFSKTLNGVTLKHVHRHKDGSLDEVTNYGGNSSDSGSALSQSFPADKFTQKLIPAASTNVWSISVRDDKQLLTYHLERHAKPRFTAVLSKTEF